MKERKRKFIYLAIGVLLMSYLAYSLSISETIETIQLANKLKVESTQLESAPKRIADIENQLNEFKISTTKYGEGIEELRNDLLFEISELARQHNLKIDNYPAYFELKRDDFTLFTSPVYLSGSYKNMVQFIYEYEQNNIGGKISSASFISSTQIKTRKRKLKLELYIQSINI